MPPARGKKWQKDATKPEKEVVKDATKPEKRLTTRTEDRNDKCRIIVS
jgi:hypothetical protein